MTRTATLAERLANPTRFMNLSGRLLPWISGLAVVVIAVGLWLSFSAPPDYQQGHTVKIMFIHVPSAWLAMAGYMLVAISSAGLLIFRHPLADVSAKAVAPIGAAFTLLALVTGSLWGKPMWGAYWVWDARLTSVLILLFLYLGLIALRSSLDDEALAGRLTALLALVGVVILPVIKFSVDWWHTLHQPSTRFTSTLDPVFRTPLLVMALGFTLMFIAMHLKAMRNEILRRRVKAATARTFHRALLRRGRRRRRRPDRHLVARWSAPCARVGAARGAGPET
jgi:heme exporter protein C